MTNPTQSDVHVDFALSNVSTAILQNPNNFIARKVFPQVNVNHLSNKYFKYPRGYFNRTEAQKRAPGTEAAEKGFAIETDTYACDVYAIKDKIPDQIRRNTDSAIDLDSDAATLVTHDLLIQQDVQFANTYFSDGVWTYDYDGVQGAPGTNEVKRWDETDSTPVDDILEASDTIMSATGLKPNTLVLGQKVYTALRRNADVIELINGGTTPGNPANAMQEQLARILDVDRVLVFNSVQNTAKEGQDDAHSFIGGNNALLCYAAPNPGLKVPTAGYSFSWTDYAGLDIKISKFREEKIKSDWVEGETAYDMKLVAADLGFFWKDLITA